MLRCWRLFWGMQRVLSVRLSSSKVNLRKLTGLGRWLKRKFIACEARRLRVRDGWWFARWGTGSTSRIFPYCVLGALSCD
jgi:hypothetical protein